MVDIKSEAAHTDTYARLSNKNIRAQANPRAKDMAEAVREAFQMGCRTGVLDDAGQRMSLQPRLEAELSEAYHRLMDDPQNPELHRQHEHLEAQV